MKAPILPAESALYERIAEIVEAARVQVARTVNTAMVHAYWLIGREIVEVQQAGKERADYGDELVKGLARRLAERFGRGFSYATVKRMKQFYLTFPNGSSIPEELGGGTKGSAVLSLFEGPESSSERGAAVLSLSRKAPPRLFPSLLAWTHYIVLMKVISPEARAFYEIEAARESWSTRELERQIGSLLFERLAKSRDKEAVLALAREGQQVSAPVDVLKDPLVLEFLALEERGHWHERDLEQAIIDRLESFLLELGRGFCFVARQKRITLDGDHFYIDLVFYNRLLRCFVLADLKIGKLSHQDLGQMQMYVNYYDHYQREEWESPAVGIVLCSDKNDAMVHITLPEDSRIVASRYQLYLPTEEELQRELEREREAAELALRLHSREADEPEG